jgi:SAM-dependent methyltransferase
MSHPGADGSPEHEVSVDYFGRHAPALLRFKTAQSLKARRAMFDEFLSATGARAGQRVVDVGVTPDTSLPDSNAFVRFWPTKETLTVTSIEDASNLETAFPGVRFVQTAGVELPFADGEFDVAHSSAVLEHVGDRDRQRAFVHEVCRVARVVFLTTPNRWFPLELHTFLPLVHWLPQPRHQQVLRTVGLRFWAETDNLNLLSASSLRSLFPPDATISVHRHRLLGLTSNLVAHGPTGPGDRGARTPSG